MVRARSARSAKPDRGAVADRRSASDAELEAWIARRLRGSLAMLVEGLASVARASVSATTMILEPGEILFEAGSVFASIKPAKPNIILHLPRGAALVDRCSSCWLPRTAPVDANRCGCAPLRGKLPRVLLSGAGPTARYLKLDARSMIPGDALGEMLQKAAMLGRMDR